MSRGSEILILDFESRLSSCSGCCNVSTTLANSLGTFGVAVTADLDDLCGRQPEIVLLRAASPRAMLEKVQSVRSICPGASCFGLLCFDEVDAEDLAACLEGGVDEFVCCPYREPVLIARITRLLKRRRPHTACAEPGTLHFGSLVAASAGLRKLLAMVPTIARSSATVLITGETGTGKELFARAIHYQSPRKGRPFVPVNCGALPDHLFENELFGHARGAYTDASTSEDGLLAEAEGGTLFLDEIDGLSATAQAKMLRLLENGEYRPLGTTKIRYANTRIVAATNGDLRHLVAKREFREDLYHRLNVLTLHVPPLRERVEDIPALACHFLAKYGAESAHGTIRLAPSALRKLMLHDWPGNVRELEKTIQRVAILAPAPVLEAVHIDLPAGESAAAAAGDSFQRAKRQAVDSFEQSYLAELMTAHEGNVSRAARAAGKERRTFQRLLRKHGLDAGAFGRGGNGPSACG